MSTRATFSRAPRRFARNDSMRLADARQLVEHRRVERLDGEQRHDADHASHLERDVFAVGQIAADRSRTRRPDPTGRTRPARNEFIPSAMIRKCSKNFSTPRPRTTSRTSPARPRSRTCCSAYTPIHDVPSLCARYAPCSSIALRSNGPTLSSPRKPPWNTLRPADVLAVHPPREVHQQLLKHALEELSRRPRPRSALWPRSGTAAARPTRAPFAG